MKHVIWACVVLLMAFPAFAAEKESSYDRVMRTGTLRCGYGIFQPMIMKDPNTGKISGIFADIMEEIGKAADIKVEFVEEVDWGQIPQALQSGKIDAMCAGMWGTAKRGKSLAFSKPLFLSVAEAYARYDDKRFDHNLAAINNANVTLSINDGDVSQEIADRMFPMAKRVSKIQMAGEDFLLMNVVTKKADVTFTTPSIAKAYIKHNPKSLRQIPFDRPLGINRNVIGVDIHETELIRMLDVAVEELQYNGVIDQIFARYDPAVTSDFRLISLK